jgi:DNA-directed RNA polymerase specialized sigma24 family protein
MLAELEALYRTRLPEFRRVAAALAGDAEAGRDAVQEAFALAVRKRRSYRGEAPLEAWVWRIVVNTAHNQRRRRSDPLPAGYDDEVPMNGSDPHPLPLELLTPRQREVLFLRYYADLDYASIGAALGISPGTVGATLTAARETLRRALQEVPG